MADMPHTLNGINPAIVPGESPWKKMKPTESPESLAKQAQIMAAEKVEHSNYVPAQLERHLEFMQQNKGVIWYNLTCFP